jgi:hypothetical protein
MQRLPVKFSFLAIEPTAGCGSAELAEVTKVTEEEVNPPLRHTPTRNSLFARLVHGSSTAILKLQYIPYSVSVAVTEVRQAHMPGNYELYDPSANRLGPVICKLCWERYSKRNSKSMNTVWVALEGRQVVWWLCARCAETLEAESTESVMFLKSSPGVITSPRV